LAAEIAVRHGYVGHAECCLMPLRDTVDFAVEWMAKYRKVDRKLMRDGDLCKL
jgi:aminoglycoside N3'-acetyltransferase